MWDFRNVVGSTMFHSHVLSEVFGLCPIFVAPFTSIKSGNVATMVCKICTYLLHTMHKTIFYLITWVSYSKNLFEFTTNEKMEIVTDIIKDALLRN